MPRLQGSDYCPTATQNPCVKIPQAPYGQAIFPQFAAKLGVCQCLVQYSCCLSSPSLQQKWVCDNALCTSAAVYLHPVCNTTHTLRFRRKDAHSYFSPEEAIRRLITGTILASHLDDATSIVEKHFMV